MSTDAIVLRKDDHQVIRATSGDFQEADPEAYERHGDLVEGMVTLLTVHPYLENNVPESDEEHHVADRLADLLAMELVGMAPDAESSLAPSRSGS